VRVERGGAARGHTIFPLTLRIAQKWKSLRQRARVLLVARSFCFSPPTTPTELSQTYPELTTLSSLPVTAEPFTIPRHHKVIKVQGLTATSTRVNSDTPYHSRGSTLVGTVWSRRGPAARRSSPAHPRSWQARFPCPSRARKRQVLSPHCTYHTTCFIRVDTLVPAAQHNRTLPNREMAERGPKTYI
jgi:hypothetical protein